MQFCTHILPSYVKANQICPPKTGSLKFHLTLSYHFDRNTCNSDKQPRVMFAVCPLHNLHCRLECTIFHIISQSKHILCMYCILIHTSQFATHVLHVWYQVLLLKLNAITFTMLQGFVCRIITHGTPMQVSQFQVGNNLMRFRTFSHLSLIPFPKR